MDSGIEKVAKARNPLRAPFLLRAGAMRLMTRTLSSALPIYLVNEYPKSGGTWLRNMLADALKLPAWSQTDPVWGSCVTQGHWLKPYGLTNAVALFRDRRDVMVSYYYHSFFLNEHYNGEMVQWMRSIFRFEDYEDIQSNPLPFMCIVMEEPVSPGSTRVDFGDIWADGPAKVVTRYEDLRRDTPSELQRIVVGLTGQTLPRDHAEEVARNHSMAATRARQHANASRSQVAEKSLVREGSLRGWAKHFSHEAREYFEGKAGHLLDALGYSCVRPAASLQR